MPRIIPAFLFIVTCSLLTADFIHAQITQTFRMAEGYVRIAEPGQLSDTLSVWGDVSSPGRYIVPRGTKTHELLAFARGVSTRFGSSGSEVMLDWSKLRLEVNISTYNAETGRETVENFTFRYSDPYPEKLRTYNLRNDQIVSVELKRRPGLPDYLRVLGPVLSVTTTVILLIDRLNN